MRSTLLVFAAVLACGGGERPGGGAGTGDFGGNLIISAGAEPSVLIPQIITGTIEKEIVDQIFDYLAEIGPDLNTVGDGGWIPRLAQSWTWAPDSLSIAFHLDPRARWQDGTPVTASDVRFSTKLYKDPRVQSGAAGSFDNVDSVTAPDERTAVVWFSKRTPEQFFELAYNLMVVPEHLLASADPANLGASAFAHAPVGSGPYRLVRWEPRARIELTADTTYYRGRPKLNGLVWTWNADPSSATTNVLTGDADFFESLSADALPRVAATGNVQAVRYRAISYGYLLFNFADPKNPRRPHPLFADHSLRLAISMALDRRAMVQNALDSLGVLSLGPFSRLYVSADTTIPQIPYDTVAADRLLDSLQWRDTNHRGIRERGGRPLRFSVLVPTSSTTRMRYAVLIQEQLRRVGVQVDIEQVDYSAIGPLMFSGKFDALLHGVTGDPSPSGIRQAWKSAPATNRGSDFAAYSNPRVDATLDSAIAEFDPTRSRALYRRAYRMIADDVPAVWLYESRPEAALNRRVHAVLDGSDYWWRDLRLWWIPAAQQLPRDKVWLVQSHK